MSVGEIRGVYFKPGFSAELINFIRIAFSDVIATNAHLKARTSSLRNSHITVIHDSIRSLNAVIARNCRQFDDPEWRVNNNRIYVDSQGFPYRKDGTILVVIADTYEVRKRRRMELIASYVRRPPSPAEYDSIFIRIVITPLFAELIRRNRVRTLGSNGGYHSYSLSDVIHHEWGHSGDLNYDQNTDLNSLYDNNGEVAERLGQLAEHRRVRAPHGSMQYQALDGSWIAWGGGGGDGIDKVIQLAAAFNPYRGR